MTKFCWNFVERKRNVFFIFFLNFWFGAGDGFCFPFSFFETGIRKRGGMVPKVRRKTFSSVWFFFFFVFFFFFWKNWLFSFYEKRFITNPKRGKWIKLALLVRGFHFHFFSFFSNWNWLISFSFFTGTTGAWRSWETSSTNPNHTIISPWHNFNKLDKRKRKEKSKTESVNCFRPQTPHIERREFGREPFSLYKPFWFQIFFLLLLLLRQMKKLPRKVRQLPKIVNNLQKYCDPLSLLLLLLSQNSNHKLNLHHNNSISKQQKRKTKTKTKISQQQQQQQKEHLLLLHSPSLAQASYAPSPYCFPRDTFHPLESQRCLISSLSLGSPLPPSSPLESFVGRDLREEEEREREEERGREEEKEEKEREIEREKEEEIVDQYLEIVNFLIHLPILKVEKFFLGLQNFEIDQVFYFFLILFFIFCFLFFIFLEFYFIFYDFLFEKSIFFHFFLNSTHKK